MAPDMRVANAALTGCVRNHLDKTCSYGWAVKSEDCERIQHEVRL